MLNKGSLWIVSSLLLGVATIIVGRTLWHLGDVYWALLIVLGLAHLSVTAVLFVVPSAFRYLKIFTVVLLVLGQWRWIEFIAMVTAWKLHGFAP